MLFGAKPIKICDFWSSFDDISKIRACLVLAIMRFLCNFWVWIEELMFEDGNLCIFDEKCVKFWAEKFFFFFSRTRPCSAGGEDEQ